MAVRYARNFDRFGKQEINLSSRRMKFFSTPPSNSASPVAFLVCLAAVRVHLAAAGYIADNDAAERQCEGERCMLLMAEIATALPSTATANATTSIRFFITGLLDSISAICGSSNVRRALSSACEPVHTRDLPHADLREGDHRRGR